MAKRPRDSEAQLDLFSLFAEDSEPPAVPTGLEVAVAATTSAPPVTPPAPRPASADDRGKPVERPRPRPRAAPLKPERLGERVAEAWHGHYGGGNIDVPLGVVAALALVRQGDPNGPSLEQQFLDLDGPSLLQVLREIWSVTWVNQPYLVEIARPLHEWLDQDKQPEYTVTGVRAVAHAAIKGGLLSITGVDDPWWRCQTDVLSPLLMELRSKGSRAGLGEFHTPAELSDVMAHMLLTPETIEPGQWFQEPAAGTGGMFRAMALVLREHDRNPHDFTWVMGELNPTAAACAAVNSIVWDLGPNVLIHVGDTLAHGDLTERAWEHRKSVWEHRNRLVEAASLAAAVRQADRLLRQATDAA